jgi:hypothetical protein
MTGWPAVKAPPGFWRGFLWRLCPRCGAPWYRGLGYLCQTLGCIDGEPW